MMPAKLIPEGHVYWHLARGVLLNLKLDHTASDLGVNVKTTVPRDRRHHVSRIRAKLG